MIFDADVLIWVLRGHARAGQALQAADPRLLSVITYMELIQGARDKAEVRMIKNFLANFGLIMLPLTENIGHRASIYMEEYALSGGMELPDALIAATAVENHQPLITGNQKHYRLIRELDLKPFRP